jgi:hypothetical protein
MGIFLIRIVFCILLVVSIILMSVGNSSGGRGIRDVILWYLVSLLFFVAPSDCLES